MKILELCEFSAGICGVWTRVLEESKRLLERGHEVRVFSSNAVKGCNEIAKPEENIGQINIKRFPFVKLGGESFMQWKFEKEALAFRPDVIVAHNYRHLHTTKALKIAKKLRKQGYSCRIFLVTHAPFVEGDITRGFISKIIVKIYDRIIGPMTLNKFDKILTISKWEIPYLLRMRAKKEKIKYIPNGIPEEFFKQKKSKEQNKILFLGRISPKKKIETLVSAIPYISDKKIKIEIVGPQEKEYMHQIKKIIQKLNISPRITFSKPVYGIREKIKKIDSARVFILPSRVEGMPQSLIEAMAREKIVIGSDSIAIRDLIQDNKTGYLFEFDNPKDLARKINLAISAKHSNIKKNALKSVQGFNWAKVMDKLEAAYLY